MQNTLEYISIKEILSRVTRNTLFKDVSLEQVIQYTIDFMEIVGVPQMFDVKEDIIHIEHFRGVIPCPVISINGVKKLPENINMRSMTDIYYPNKGDKCHPRGPMLTFKVQNRIIFTGFECGDVLINYNTTKIDDSGYPMIFDDGTFLKALQLYIEQEVLTYKFYEGKIQAGILQNAQQRYAWSVGQLQNKLSIPSVDEMESIKNEWCTLLQRTTEFDDGFRTLGNREYMVNH